MKWQPIETAQKDCAVLLLTTAGIEVARWFAGAQQWVDTNGEFLWGQPTHWMPLPDPPVSLVDEVKAGFTHIDMWVPTVHFERIAKAIDRIMQEDVADTP